VADKSPPRGRTRKSAPPPKTLNPLFELQFQKFFLISGIKVDHSTYRSARLFKNLWSGFFVKWKNIFLLRGTWPPNLTTDLYVPRNLRRAHRGAHDPENISEIARTVSEKIDFEKNLGTPWRPNRKRSRSRDHIRGKLSLGTRILENMKTLGLEMTTLFDFFDIAFGPTNGMSRKILLYTHVRQQKILLRSRNP